MVDLWFLQGKWLPQATPSGQQTATVAQIGKTLVKTQAPVLGWLKSKYNYTDNIQFTTKPTQAPQIESKPAQSTTQANVTTTKWLPQASSQSTPTTELQKVINQTQFNEFPTNKNVDVKIDIPQPPANNWYLPWTDINKMDMSTFAHKIKDQYPEYANMDDVELATKMMNKFPQYQEKVDTPLGSQRPVSDITQKIVDSIDTKVLENHIHMSEQQLAQLTPEQRAKFDANGDYESWGIYNPAAIIAKGMAKFVNTVAYGAETAIRGTTSLADRAGKGIAEWIVDRLSPNMLENIKQFNRDNPNLYKVAKAYTDMWGMQVTTRDAIADVANGVTTSVAAIMPVASIALNIASETPWAKEALGFAINKVISPSLLRATYKVVPWLEKYRNSLTEDRAQQFDMTVWSTELAMIMWGKYKNPKTGKIDLKTLSSNLNPAILVPNFERALFNTTTKVSSLVQNIFKPSIDIGGKIDITWKVEPEGKVTTLDRLIASKTGIDAENVRFFKDNPELIKEIDEWRLTKEWFKNEIVKVIDNMKNDTQTIGKLYQEAYKQADAFDTRLIIMEMQNNLKDKGVVFDVDGKITGFDTTNPYAANIKIAEQWVIKRMYNQTVMSIKDKPDLTVQQTHASRIALYKASYSEWVSTKSSPTLRALSSVFDTRLKWVDWFAKIDADYKASVSDLNAISKLVLNRQWDFKWTLKAMLGEAQYKKLQALETIIPWATKKLEAIKAWDDYIRARETHKVGFYSKVGNMLQSWGIWWLLGWTMGWPIGAVLGTLLVELVSAKIFDPDTFKNWIIKNVPKWQTIVAQINAGKPLMVSQQKVIIAKLKANNVMQGNVEMWMPMTKTSSNIEANKIPWSKLNYVWSEMDLQPKNKTNLPEHIIDNSDFITYKDAELNKYAEKISDIADSYVQVNSKQNMQKVIDLYNTTKGKQILDTQIEQIKNLYPEQVNSDWTITMYRWWQVKDWIQSFSLDKNTAQWYADYQYWGPWGNLQTNLLLESKWLTPKGKLNEVRVKPEQIKWVIQWEEILVDYKPTKWLEPKAWIETPKVESSKVTKEKIIPMWWDEDTKWLKPIKYKERVHYTDDKEPILISNNPNRLIPKSISLWKIDNTAAWAFGKNRFVVWIDSNAKIFEVNYDKFYDFGKEEDTPINRGKEIYKYAKDNWYDAILIKNSVHWLWDELSVINPKVIRKESKWLKPKILASEKLDVDRITKESKWLKPKANEVVVYRTGDSDWVDTDLNRAIERGMNKTTKVFIVNKSELKSQSKNKSKFWEYKV